MLPWPWEMQWSFYFRSPWNQYEGWIEGKQVFMLGDQLVMMGKNKVNRFQWHMLTKVDVGNEETCG